MVAPPGSPKTYEASPAGQAIMAVIDNEPAERQKGWTAYELAIATGYSLAYVRGVMHGLPVVGAPGDERGNPTYWRRAA